MSIDPSRYGDSVADLYDELFSPSTNVEAEVKFLRELAGDGNVLELGIGTGRVAIPLAAQGVKVTGVDSSTAMIAKLRAKPGSEGIVVHHGDFAEVQYDGTFSLAYVVVNTFFAVPSRNQQLACFRNVRKHLSAGGKFLIEAYVPDTSVFTRGQGWFVHDVTPDAVVIEASRHDPIEQTVRTQMIVIKEASTRLIPIWSRYVYPSELDLMANLAGFKLRDRFGGWKRQSFHSMSRQHISVYEVDDAI